MTARFVLAPAGLTDGQTRLVGLDGMRGTAILLVFGVHWTLAWMPWLPTNSSWTDLAAATFAAGNAGVDLFFALSGLLIYDHFLSRPTGAGTFLKSRAWRIYPTYLVVFALYLTLSIFVSQPDKLAHGDIDLWYLLRSALLLPGIVQEQPIVGVAWSLSYELAFYLFLPPFVLLTGLRRRGTATRCAWILAAAGALLASACFTGLHERLLLFPAGMLARELAVARPDLVAGIAYRMLAAIALPIGLAAIIAIRTPWPFLNPNFSGSLACAAIGCVTFGLTIPASIQQRGIVGALSRVKPLRFLGRISYSFYLLHNLVIRALMSAAPAAVLQAAPGGTWLVTLPFGFAAALAAGLVLFLTVERPCLKARLRPRGGLSAVANLET